MRFERKIKLYLQVLSLLFVVILGGGRELLHPFFHPESLKTVYGLSFYENDCCCFIVGWTDTEKEDILPEYNCPLCSCPAGEYMSPALLDNLFIDSAFSIYSVSAEECFFRTCLKKKSRGPPCA